MCTFRMLDGLHLVFTAHAMYTYLITGFGDYLALNHIVWSFKVCDESMFCHIDIQNPWHFCAHSYNSSWKLVMPCCLSLIILCANEFGQRMSVSIDSDHRSNPNVSLFYITYTCNIIHCWLSHPIFATALSFQYNYTYRLTTRLHISPGYTPCVYGNVSIFTSVIRFPRLDLA